MPKLSLRILPLIISSVLVNAHASSALPLKDIQLFADVFEMIKTVYVDDVSDSKLIENAVRGMVEKLDPHSSYLDFKDFKDLEESSMGEFGGLGMEVTKDPLGVRIVTPIDDTPAQRAGVMSGDIIVKLDGKATTGMTLSESVKMMRGKPKTSITITIARKGVSKPIVLKIVRDIIKIRSVKSKQLSDDIGYIRISQFQERTGTDVAKAVSDLLKNKALKGLILDLRNNPGGLLQSAVGVSAAFLPADSLVVSTRGRFDDSNQKLNASYRDYAMPSTKRDDIGALPPISKTVPLVVLINSASASASEIVAGALQDHHRATLMGSRSFGKGSVQTVLPMRQDKKDGRLGIKITTARYYTPSGRSIQAEGIRPDILVDDTPQGNYPSFTIRESDLARHIENEKKGLDPEEPKAGEEEATETPTLRYVFGDDKDFPLQQAKNHLLGKKVVTHADVLAQRKARKDEKSADSTK